jgi:hypothetical protein
VQELGDLRPHALSHAWEVATPHQVVRVDDPRRVVAESADVEIGGARVDGV